MPRDPRAPLGVAALLTAGALGCAYSNIDRQVDRTPEVTTGTGAVILMPGDPGYDEA